MVKRIYETFTDDEMTKLLEVKGSMTWREFILSLTDKKVKE